MGKLSMHQYLYWTKVGDGAQQIWS